MRKKKVFFSETSLRVFFVSGAQILNNSWVLYISPMIKMYNQNMTQPGTQATNLGVMIGGGLLIANMGDPVVILPMLAVLFFRYTNDDLRNHTNQRRKHKIWTWEDSQLAPHCYFRSNTEQRGYRKIMIETW